MFKKIKRFIIEFLGGSADRIYPTSFQAVDIVVINHEQQTILMGQKWTDKTRTKAKNEIRFCGGFVDPTDPTLEFAARREGREEAGSNLEISDPIYAGSIRIDDPRYRNSVDKIMSAIFVSNYIYGFAEGGDDIACVKWYGIRWLLDNYKKEGVLAKEHIPVVDLLIEKGVI